jgi:2,4-dienoyl-CoA reductase (NADPH2)
MSFRVRFSFKDSAELLAKAASLGVVLPFSENIESLFQPLSISGKKIANRIAVQPMEGADAELDGSPSELTIRRYRRFAGGGSGLIWFEAVAIREDGKSHSRQLFLNQETLGAFSRLVEETRSAARKSLGQRHAPLLILQLTHSGRFSKSGGRPKPVIAHHNPYLDPLHRLPADYPLVSDRELDRLQDAFAEAAALAGRAGFDGIDLKSCHGYLVSELFGARTRTDSRYGGSFPNRVRFLLETINKIGALIPKSLVCARVGAFDAIPYPYGFGTAQNQGDSMDLTEPMALVRRLSESKLFLLNVTAGIPAFLPHLGRPYDAPVRGGARSPEHPLLGVARLIHIAGQFQGRFPALPVVGGGYSWLRQFFPRVAAGVLEKKQASLVGLGRLSFAYPGFAEDLRAKGALDPKKICLTCSGCSELLHAGRPAGCVVRDKSVYRRFQR